MAWTASLSIWKLPFPFTPEPYSLYNIVNWALKSYMKEDYLKVG